MGCDGGTIPKRHELVKTKQRPEQKDVDMARTAKWKCCAITQNPLVPPIVSCEMGNLYNKESVLEYLLNKSSCDSVPHIRSLKDVKELNLTKNTGYNSKLGELADKYYDTQAAIYICPVAGLEMNGKYSFGFIWTCGCVVSSRAIKEVPSEVCHKCGKPFSVKDFVLINSDGEDMERMKSQMETRRADAKLKRKSKSKNGTSTETSAVNSAKSNGLNTNDKKTDGTTTNEDINGTVPKPSTSSTKKAEKRSLKYETSKSNATSHSTGEKKAKVAKSATLSVSKYKTVAEDPNASKVFKSLFTSSEAAQNRPQYKQSNWVTYNPYHL